MDKKITKELIEFIKASPTSFHAINTITTQLQEAGYEELSEANLWQLRCGGKYYVTRNHSSIIAFHVGTDLHDYSFHIAASHSDSPTFKVKENAQLEMQGKYTRLNTEGYGGMLCAAWLDRPLSLAGRVIVKEGNSFVTRLVKIDRDLVLIPNVAIHLNRDVNQGYAYNKQVDMLPLLGGSETGKNDYKHCIAKELKVKPEDICGMDIYLYNRNEPSVWGAHEEFVLAPRLDDLQCAFATLQGFLKGFHPQTIQVFACFDNEEVGSRTKQGADSTFLYDTLYRINQALGMEEEAYHKALALGFMVSADNAQAVHPNHPELTDVNNCVYMNEGIVIKSHAQQSYASDALSLALFKEICERTQVPVQFFANRSDKMSGGTLGNISQSHVSINTVEVGIAQLAMHSCYETAGVKDTEYLIKAMKQFYSTYFHQIDATHVEMITKEDNEMDS